VALVEFLNSTNLEILNRGNYPTCNSRRVEVIDITLGSCELLERIKDWEVSSEPSLSDHRHIMFKLVGLVPAGFFRDPRSTNRDSFWADLESRPRDHREFTPPKAMQYTVNSTFSLSYKVQPLCNDNKKFSLKITQQGRNM
jgi:hypothetical protein